MSKWYVFTFNDIRNETYWEDVWMHSTVLVNEDDFEAVSRAFYHTYKQCHYVELHDGNIHAYPEYVQQAYHNREKYVSPK